MSSGHLLKFKTVNDSEDLIKLPLLFLIGKTSPQKAISRWQWPISDWRLVQTTLRYETTNASQFLLLIWRFPLKSLQHLTCHKSWTTVKSNVCIFALWSKSWLITMLITFNRSMLSMEDYPSFVCRPPREKVSSIFSICTLIGITPPTWLLSYSSPD